MHVIVERDYILSTMQKVQLSAHHALNAHARDSWLPMWLLALSEAIVLSSPHALSEAGMLNETLQLFNSLLCLLLYLYKMYTTKKHYKFTSFSIYWIKTQKILNS